MIDMEPACRRMTDLVACVADNQLASPTPCVDYSVGDLLDHIDKVSRGFAEVARGNAGEPADTDTAAEPSAANLGARWRERLIEDVRALGEAWADPDAWIGSTPAAGLDMPNELWGKIALTEMVVHGWDVARATDQPFDLPEETLRACLDHVAEFVPNAPLPELWGSAADVPADAGLLDRVVAITGRNP